MMKRIVVLSGGLGNQMFQYAFYLSMKNKGVSCKLDTNLYSSVQMHNGFELQKVFSISAKICKNSLLNNLWIRLLRKYRPSALVYSDKRYEFCPDVYCSKQPYLVGDWISEDYFSSIGQIVRDSFSFQNISNRNSDLSEVLRTSNSVSLHIRRGDYLEIPKYHVCNDNYYEKAISIIKDSVESPVFYVFSNEPSWCKSFMEKFDVKFCVVDWNQEENNYQDMYLMSQCRHHIIANSTFSWWGAWLCDYNKSLVVAPKRWFKDSELNANCKNWCLIDN